MQLSDTSPLHITSTAIQPKPSNCCSNKAQTQGNWVNILGQICRVALAAFACFISPVLFGASFAFGALASIGHYLWTEGSDKTIGSLRPVCGQGYMEFLSGKTFPLWTVYVVTTAFIAAHVRHDPIFFVPFCGTFLGWCAGSQFASFSHRMIALPPHLIQEQMKKPCCHKLNG